jgi:parallel beta-helix repeat protein
MRRTFFLWALFSTFAITCGAAWGDFYVIPVGRGAGTEIKSLPYTISSPGFYYITSNLTATGTGIGVEANNVMIDLMGFTISGSGSEHGIAIHNWNIEIRNGTVENFYIGISALGKAKGTRIINMRVVSNNDGIHLSNFGHLVKDCTIMGNAHDGIYIGGSSTIIGNVVFENDRYGIYTGTGSMVAYNTAYKNSAGPTGGSAIAALGHSTVSFNTAYDNSATGISCGTGSMVSFNTANDNLTGFIINEGSTVTNNTSYNNEHVGFIFDSRHTVYHNTAYNNDSGNYTGCSSGCTIGENYMP